MDNGKEGENSSQVVSRNQVNESRKIEASPAGMGKPFSGMPNSYS
jgi:hypothetical protein